MGTALDTTGRNGGDALSDLAWRVTGLLDLYRILSTAGLFILGRLSVTVGMLNPPHAAALQALCLVHFGAAIVLVLFRHRHRPDADVLALSHVATDSLGFGGIVWAAGGISSGLGILLVLPVGAMALLARHENRSYLLASLATLALLLQQVATHFSGDAGPGEYIAAGLLGCVLFVTAVSVRPLANRLRDSESRMRRQEIDLENLAQLSQYIVQHLRESILVIDASDRVRLINESAAALLGPSIATRGSWLGESSPRLLHMASAWRGAGEPDDRDGAFLAADGLRSVQPHFVQLGPTRDDAVLVFLEDTSLLAKKVQESKLAALGRLSASIAHEVRNPVGAMSHAAQLLAESTALPEADRRLTRIITGNATRVSRLVGNMLEFSRRGSGNPERIELGAWLARFRDEFCATLQLPPDKLDIRPAAHPSPGEPVAVRFDPTQLHQIIWNLCQNALAHGGAATAGQRIDIAFGRLAGSGRPYVEVSDRGASVPQALRERAFEPFFTTSGLGTGLGLFLARELAQGNDAALVFDGREGGGSTLRLVFSDPARWST
ncbi:MAG: hypothetical protein RLZZ393_794 [Pseudomonadota bacterium]|jgi:two-component system sensor histidine kinase PilS (NtrC family)